MKIIDAEAHFYTASYLEYLRSRKNYPRQETEDGVTKLRYSDDLWQLALLCSLFALGVDRIAFPVDYPYESNEEGAHFIKESPVSDADREKICYRNAERLFKL